MLTLSILKPKSGNGASGEFPFNGRFGVDDLRIDGVLSAHNDERSGGGCGGKNRVLVRRVFVRLVRVVNCHGRRSIKTVLAKQVIWTPPDGAAFAEIKLGQYDFSVWVTEGKEGLSYLRFSCHGKPVEVLYRLDCIAELHDGSILQGQNAFSVELARPPLFPLLPDSPYDLTWTEASPITIKELKKEEERKPDRVVTPPPFDFELRVLNRPYGARANFLVDAVFSNFSSPDVVLKRIELILVRTTTAFSESSEKPLFIDTELLYVPADDLPDDVASSSAELPFGKAAGRKTQRGRLAYRMPTGGYSVGETGSNELIQVDFTLTARVSWTYTSNRWWQSDHSLLVEPVPVYIGAKLKNPDDFSRPPRYAPHMRPPVSRGPSVQSLPNPPPPPYRFDARPTVSASNLALPHPPARASPGRRMSAYSEAISEPARTKPRRDPPGPLLASSLAAAAKAGSSGTPSLASPGLSVSRSSTLSTLGPETPSTLEFAQSSASPPSAAARASPSSHLHPHASPRHALPHPHPHSQPHAHARRARPRTAHSPRTATFDAALALARSAREQSAPLPSTSSALLLGSPDGRAGGGGLGALSLVEDDEPASPSHAGEGEDAVFAYAAAMDPSVSATSTPPSSPDPDELLSPPPPPSSATAFRDPFVVVDGRLSRAGVDEPALAHLIAASATAGAAGAAGKALYVSPLARSHPALSSASSSFFSSGAAAPPHLSAGHRRASMFPGAVPAPLPSPPSTAQGGGAAEPPRRKSIGGLLSRFTGGGGAGGRRASKVAPPTPAPATQA
ncbi:hypothetical protein JCM10207_008844 [Rhodosporidiobolus poonsookiae]